MENLALLLLGLLLSALGITNIKGNIGTIHAYHRQRVSDEDVPRYGKAVGTGTLVIGVACVIGFFLSFWNETVMAVVLLVSTVLGVGCILYGQFKYNGGIF